MKAVCVFCGSADGDPGYLAAAQSLGRELAASDAAGRATVHVPSQTVPYEWPTVGPA
jgi:predicted Rossmann-fold nucleotide-binding protein